MRLTDAGPVMQAVLALAMALIAAPVVRSVTAELNGSVGRAWPFSLTRCVPPATPGCDRVSVRSAAGQPAMHIRTGRL